MSILSEIKNNHKAYTKLLLSCAIRSFIWISLMVIIRNQDIVDLSGKDNLWMIFFSIVGVIYAITIAFLLVIVLEKFNKFSATMLEEINLIQDIRDFLIFIKVQPEVKAKLYSDLLKYVESIYKEEFPKMKKARNSKENLNSDTCKNIYNVITDIKQIEPKTHSGTIALQELIKKNRRDYYS